MQSNVAVKLTWWTGLDLIPDSIGDSLGLRPLRALWKPLVRDQIPCPHRRKLSKFFYLKRKHLSLHLSGHLNIPSLRISKNKPTID